MLEITKFEEPLFDPNVLLVKYEQWKDSGLTRLAVVLAVPGPPML